MLLNNGHQVFECILPYLFHLIQYNTNPKRDSYLNQCWVIIWIINSCVEAISALFFGKCALLSAAPSVHGFIIAMCEFHTLLTMQTSFLFEEKWHSCNPIGILIYNLALMCLPLSLLHLKDILLNATFTAIMFYKYYVNWPVSWHRAGAQGVCML